MRSRGVGYAVLVALTVLPAACSAAPATSPIATPSAASPATPSAPSTDTGPTGIPTPDQTASATQARPSATPPSPAATTTTGRPAARGGFTVSDDAIPYPQSRKEEMAAYSARHYAAASWALDPQVIVLHFTESDTWTSARSTFAADTPSLGELPGTCAHYVVDQQGVVHALVPTSVRCRHTIGLNDVAIGIEFVQATHGNTSAWADRQILARTAQVEAGLALVRQLQARYGIATADVIGHASANSHRLFHDRQGWRNDHTDWQAADVEAFRARL